MNASRNAIEIVLRSKYGKPATITDRFDKIKIPIDKGYTIRDRNGIQYRVSGIVSARTGGRTFIQVRQVK